MRAPRSTRCVCRLLLALLFLLIFASIVSKLRGDDDPEFGNPVHRETAFEGRRPDLHARPDIRRNGIVKSLIEMFDRSEVAAGRIAEYMAANVDVQYEGISNLEKGPWRRVAVALTNRGQESIPRAGWAIYLNHQFNMLNGMDNITEQDSLQVEHMGGNLFRLSPQVNFPGLAPGQVLILQLSIFGSIFSREFVYPNWFVSVPGETPQTIRSTTWEDHRYVKPIDTFKKWKRYPTDLYNPWTAAERFNRNNVTNYGSAQHLVIPTPMKVSDVGATKVTLTSIWVVVTDPASRAEAEFLAGKLGMQIAGVQPSTAYILLSQSGISVGQVGGSLEGYKMTVTSSNVIITSPSNRGIFYGVQSLLDMTAITNTVPTVTITDAPRFDYRGFMIDVARNFRQVADVERVIDVMAMYKLNTLHLHLTDDEGWRVEINDLPQLTAVGGCRYHKRNDNEHHLEPSLGSGPEEAGLGCGFYTTAEYRHLLRYAQARHITVIPEIDIPGHSRAAIIAMKARHRDLMSRGDARGAARYLLHDPGDASDYFSAQMYKDNVLNLCLNSTYVFIDTVIANIVKLHADIQPLQYFHFGGDEIPHGVHERSPLCQKFLGSTPHRSNPNVNALLMDYFFERVTDIVDKYKLKLVGWQDVYYKHLTGGMTSVPRPLQSSTQPLTAIVWQNSWKKNQGRIPYELANLGYQVILCPSSLVYLDHPQEPHPDEKGLSWATRYINIKKVFRFMPDSYYDNIDETHQGDSISKDTLCTEPNIQCPPLLKPENVIGVHSALWSEMLPHSHQFFSMVLPRLIAFAERAWHAASWESITNAAIRKQQMNADWAKFANTLGYRELPRLHKLNYLFYLPPPGAKFKNGGLKINSAIPGLPIQYFDVRENSWKDISSSTRLLNNSLLATCSFDRSRRSRSVTVIL